MKNLLETKSVRRLLVEGNVFENNWQDAQDGFAFVLKSENPGQHAMVGRRATSPSATTTSRGRGACSTSPPPAAIDAQIVPAARFLITNNLVEAVNTGPFGGDGKVFQILSGLSDLVITHNTVINQNSNLATVVFDGPPARGFVMHSNVLGAGQYGIKGGGAGVGRATLAKYAPGGVFERNVLVGADCSAYPSGTACPDRMTLGRVHQCIRRGFPRRLRRPQEPGSRRGRRWRRHCQSPGSHAGRGRCALAGAGIGSPTEWIRRICHQLAEDVARPSAPG